MSRIWHHVHQLGAALARHVMTTRSWKSTRQCPTWCAGSYRCSAWRNGEHRSEPLVFRDERFGTIVVVGVESAAGVRAVEVRLRVVQLQAGEVAELAARTIGRAS